MANEPTINLALVGEMPENPVRGTIYMSPDTSGNFVKVGVDGSVRTIFDGSIYALRRDLPWTFGEGEGSAVLKVGGSEADGDGAVAHGENVSASGYQSHAEGIDTIAYGAYSHAEGNNTTAVGNNSHAEGMGEYYLMDSSISGEAGSTSYTLSKSTSFRQNQIIYYANTNTYAKIISRTNTTLTLDKTLDANNALIDASFYILKGYAYDYSHTEGYNSNAEGLATHAEGYSTVARYDYSHTEGYNTETNSNYSHAEGENTKTDINAQSSHAEGYNTVTTQPYSHAEGSSTNARAAGSHAEGSSTNTYGPYSHTEGINTMTRGNYSHAEGKYATAYGDYSHAEGVGSNNTSYIQAKRTGNSNFFMYVTAQPHNLHINDILVSSNIYARVINILNDTTFETDSNARLWTVSSTTFKKIYIVDNNVAYSSGSHAEGNFTTAIGEYSHAEGYKTIATNTHEHAQGMFNISHASTLFSIGNGGEVRSNALEIDREGNAYLYGVASFDGQTITPTKTLQYFLNVNLISGLEYNYIFSISSPVINNLLSSHLIIDRIPEDILPDIEDSYGSLSDYIADIVTDVDNRELYPGGSGGSVSTLGKPGPSNRWEWSGDMMSIDGNDYYVWYCISSNSSEVIYGLMPVDMTLETCIDNSMYSDISNRWSPFEYIIANDTIQDYEDLPVRYTLIYVKEYEYDTRTIGDFNLLNATLYLDTFDDDTFTRIGSIYSDAEVVNISEYIDYYCENNLNDGVSTECTYQEDITFDGETYHMWYCENGGGYEFYCLMPLSVTAEEVANNSKYANPFNLYCPFTYELDIDEEVYSDDPSHLKTRRCLVTVVPGE